MNGQTSGRDLARAALAQTRANTCTHGVKLDRCADCSRVAAQAQEDTK